MRIAARHMPYVTHPASRLAAGWRRRRRELAGPAAWFTPSKLIEIVLEAYRGRADGRACACEARTTMGTCVHRPPAPPR